MNKWRLAIGLGVLGVAPSVIAEISTRGFASFVGGRANGGDLESTASVYGDSLDFQKDSLIALQFDADLEDNLSATVQFMAKGRERYSPKVEWAYVTYEFSEALQLSAGRVRVPFFRYSDFLDVRYTYNWVTAPKEVYGIDFSSLDGLSLLYMREVAGWDSSLQIVRGQFDGDIGGADALIEDMSGVSLTLNKDWFTFRAGYIQSKTSVSIPDMEGLSLLIQGVGAGFGQDLSGLANSVLVEEDDGNFAGIAFGVDYNNFLLDVEYVEYAIDDSLVPDTSGYYLSLGYRFDKFVPNITYSQQDADKEDDLSGQVPAPIDVTPLPDLGGATLSQMLAGAVAATESEKKVMELGIRYEFHHSAAFKMSVLKEETLDGNDYSLARFGVDLIF